MTARINGRCIGNNFFDGAMGMLGKDDNTAQRIWRIRNLIQTLEEVKDTIIKFLNSQETLNVPTQHMWISDVKEAYYNVVAGWQMLNATAKGEKTYAASSQQFLEAANSRVEQCISELRSIDDKHALELETKLQRAFNACHTAIVTELEPYIDPQDPNPPQKRIIKINESEYHLPCMICGEIAVIFELGEFLGESGMIYHGITHRTSLDLPMKDSIVHYLNHNNIAGIHSLVQEKKSMEDGLDAYCPECDKIYCKKHYHITEEWDEGFYDCSYGTCPEGHRRIIDD